eukprot:269285_1
MISRGFRKHRHTSRWHFRSRLSHGWSYLVQRGVHYGFKPQPSTDLNSTKDASRYKASDLRKFKHAENSDAPLWETIKLINRGGKPDIFLYTEAIKRCMLSDDKKRVDIAVSIGDHMLTSRVRPDTIFLNAMMTAVRHSGNMDLVTKYWDIMKSMNIKPSSRTLKALLGGCYTCRRPELALGFIKEMLAWKITAEYNSVVRLIPICAETLDLDTAEKLFAFISQSRPNDVPLNYEAMAHVAAQCGDVQTASRYYSVFVSPDSPPSLELANTVVEAALSAGNFDFASLILRDLTYMELGAREGALDLRALPVATAQGALFSALNVLRTSSETSKKSLKISTFSADVRRMVTDVCSLYDVDVDTSGVDLEVSAESIAKSEKWTIPNMEPLETDVLKDATSNSKDVFDDSRAVQLLTAYINRHPFIREMVTNMNMTVNSSVGTVHRLFNALKNYKVKDQTTVRLKAHELFWVMKHVGISPSIDVMNSYMRVLAASGDVSACQSIIAALPSSRLQPDVQSIRNLLGACIYSGGDVVSAERALTMATRLNLDLVPVMGVALRVCLKANDYASARRFISGLQSQTERTHHSIVAAMLKLACAHNDLEAASKYLRQIPKFGRYQGLVQQCAQTFISAAVKQEEWTLAEKAFGFAAANCNLFKTHTLHGDHRERMNLSDTSSEFMEAAMCQLKNSSTSEPVIVILDTKEDRERCLAAAERLGVSASNHGNVGFYVTLDAQTFIDPEERKALLDAEGRIKRCMENGEPQRALLVLSQAIRDPRFVPTPAIYECGLRAIIASDQTSIELVDSLIQKLISSETQLANPSLLLELCTFLCEKQLGQEVFCPKRMMKLRQAGMNLSIDDFNRLISKASEHKSSPKVEDFTTWLRHFRITPNQKSFRLALDLYEPSVALTVITRFERLKFVHTETSLNAVALLCLQHRKYDTAAEYFQKFADSGFQLDKTVAARVLPTIETSQTLGSLSMLDTLSSVGHPLSKDDWQRLVAMHEISGRSDMADEVMARACRTEEFRECQLTEDGVLLLAGVSEIAAKVFTRRALESLIRSPESGLRQIRVTVASESARKQVELAAQESSAFVLPSDDPFVVILSMEPPMTSSRLLNMMNSHISVGNTSKAIDVFFDSLSKDFRPGDSVFSRALDCCDSARALEILSLIQASDIRVQPEHAHKALSVLLSADKLEEAERFFDSLEKFGVSLDETMCQEIICAFGQSAELDKARIYFDRISQISP